MPRHISDSTGHVSPDRQWFPATLWTAIITMRQHDSPQAEEALEKLSRAYRPPLCRHVQRQGYSPEDAEDLIQTFLAKLQQKNFWARGDKQKGSFRNLLLTALHQFLIDERKKAHAGKRGGGAPVISLDEQSGEQFIANADHACSPDQQYDEEWASNVMEQAMAKLRQWCSAKGKLALLDCVNLLGDDEKSLTVAVAAKQLGMSESAFKTACERLRKRFARLVREEVARTVSNPAAELEEEIRYLLSVFERRKR